MTADTEALTAPSTPSTDAPADPPAAALCPRCGYDLRGTAGDRCSECGLVLDRAALAVSGFPWAHRRKVGRVRTFLQTVWLVTTDRPRVREELAKPQRPADAVWFQGWVAAGVAVALLVAAAAAEHRFGMDELLAQPRTPYNFFAASGSLWQSGSGPVTGAAQDLAVPWCAGVTLLPAVVGCLVGLALYSVGVGRATMRLRELPPENGRRARAVARYAAAPLALLLPAAVALATAELIRADQAKGYGSTLVGSLDRGGLTLQLAWAAVDPLLWGAAALAAAGGLLTVHRWGQWHARAHHAGAGRYAAGVAEVVGRSALGWALFLGVGPWCAGLLRIVWASWP